MNSAAAPVDLLPGDPVPARAWGFLVAAVDDDVIEGRWLSGVPGDAPLFCDQVIMLIGSTGDPEVSLISFMQVHPDHGPRIAPGWWTARHGDAWPPEMIDACRAGFDQALAWETGR